MLFIAKVDMKESVIELNKVSKYYGEIRALEEIDLSIAKEDFITIFGANGAGKSTLLKVLSKQTRQSKGSIKFRGTQYSKLGDNFKSNFGVISHQPFLYENLTALENLEFYASLYGVKDRSARAKDLLKKMNLYSRKDDVIRTYSRGMLQRVSIIRAIMHSPEVIFLDEPYTGLDAVASNMLTTLLREELEGKKTIVMVTHDLDIGLSLATHVLIMKKGKVIFSEDRDKIEANTFEKEYIDISSKV